MLILAIDPGNEESGYAVIDGSNCKPLDIGKISNPELHNRITGGDFNRADIVSIEMIASYGMPVGKEVFETCVWIGRYLECSLDLFADVDLVYRVAVKHHHCHSSKAKDPNVIQALVDRFASGVRNRGKGTKDTPGWFYGFRADIWQAYALAVYTADTVAQRPAEVSLRAGAREVAS